MSSDDKTEEDKLIIKLDKKLPKHATIDLNIKYSAGYYHHPYGIDMVVILILEHLEADFISSLLMKIHHQSRLGRKVK